MGDKRQVAKSIVGGVLSILPLVDSFAMIANVHTLNNVAKVSQVVGGLTTVGLSIRDDKEVHADIGAGFASALDGVIGLDVAGNISEADAQRASGVMGAVGGITTAISLAAAANAFRPTEGETLLTREAIEALRDATKDAAILNAFNQDRFQQYGQY